MKGFRELIKLPFGTIIYDLRDGEKGIVGCLELDSILYILWETTGAIEYSDIDDYIEFSLEKPKRKVKHELVRFVTDACINDLLTKSWVNRNLLEEMHTNASNKIVITFETEE